MYNNKFFRINEKENLVKLIRETGGFGTIVLKGSNGFMATSVPMLVDDSGTFLEGHIASANPMVTHMDNEEVIVVFIEADHYISANWYGESIPVPTWNYIEVQVLGKLHVIHGETELIRILDNLSDIQEKNIRGNWKTDWNVKQYEAMLREITGFRIDISHIEGKMKLSQNHKKENIEYVVSSLRKVGTNKAMEFADIMEKSISEGKDWKKHR